MASAATESLRVANDNLRAGLARLLLDPNASAPLRPQDLSRLHASLLRAGDCLRSLSPGSPRDAELENTISEYRSIVEQLAQVLPRVHGRFLAERARLERARAHLEATAAWARASQKTL